MVMCALNRCALVQDAGGEGAYARLIRLSQLSQGMFNFTPFDDMHSAAQAGEEAASGAEAQGTGIILKRLGKGAGAAGGAAAVGGAVRTQVWYLHRQCLHQKFCTGGRVKTGSVHAGWARCLGH